MNSQAQTYFAVGPRLPRPAPPRRTAAALAGALPDKSGSVFKDRPRRRKMPPPRIRAAPGSVPDVQSRPGRLRRVGSKLAKTPPPSQPPFFNFFFEGGKREDPEAVPGQFLGLRSALHLPVRVADLKPCARSGASTPRGNGASHRPPAPAADASPAAGARPSGCIHFDGALGVFPAAGAPFAPFEARRRPCAA